MGGGNRPGYSFSVRARSDGRREFFQHDDREYEKATSSSVSYPNRTKYNYTRGGGGSNNRTWQAGEGGSGRGGHRGQRGGSYRGKFSRNYLTNDDVLMPEGKGRHQEFYENSRRSRRGKKEGFRGRTDGYRGKTDGFRGSADGFRKKSSISSRAPWHKIVIFNTSLNEKDEAMEMIKDSVNDLFSPVLLNEEGKNLTFYLEKQPHIAKSILTLSNRISLSNGHRLAMKCIEVPPPPIKKLTEIQTQTLIAVMSERYGIEMKRLDLKNFHNDPTLIKERIFCPLFRRTSLASVLEIIIAHIPHVEEIDFSNNQLTTINDIEALRDFENLKRLNFDNNKINYVDPVKFKELPVEELTFIGNPIREQFSDNKAYRTAMSKSFPKLRLLDGVEVERQIGFAVETEVLRVPKSKAAFSCNDEAKNLVQLFIHEYYREVSAFDMLIFLALFDHLNYKEWGESSMHLIFEVGNRRELEPAYTEDALFSLTANFPEVGFGAKFTAVYMRENRNLLTITTPERKHRLLAKGRLDVIDAIFRLPEVRHDPDSLCIDIPVAMPNLFHVVVTGVFKQIVDAQSPIRNFIRSLIIVPVGGGLCISNEELFVNSATSQQASKAFKTISPAVVATPVNSPDVSVSALPTTSGTIVNQPITEQIQIDLINQFAVASKMLPEYCKMCLEQNNWDYAKAGEMFLDLQKDNKIPVEYFGTPV